MKKKKTNLKRLSEEILENKTKVVVLGDAATNGDSLAVAFVTFPKEDT